MALHYLLDGYNIIKSDPSGELARGSLEEQRTRLITCIRDRRPEGSARNRVTVVFDGPASVPFLSGSASRYHVGSIEIVFSEGVPADRRIEEIVEETGEGAGIVVVSNDRGLRRLLGGSGARFMSVEEFTGKLRGHARGSGDRTAETDDTGALSSDITEELKKRWGSNNE